MERITRQLNEVGARMITLGDARQLQPIQAGAAFRAFVDVTGYVELDSVVRQSEPWMREAAIAFGSGRAEEGVSAYLDQDKLAWAETVEDARAALIRDWMPYHQASVDITMMAHRNKDVIALNVEARDALRLKGALGEDQSFAAERGQRVFADGDRVLFLKNERSLGVFNGSTGTVRAAEQNRLEVLVDGHADPITIRANEYNYLDHGYARTIHKEQGNTVDRSFVYLSPTMDAQLSYVALTRHRDDVTMYASAETFRSSGELFDAMTRDRLQDTTVLYRDRVDYKEVVRGFAERRGFPTTGTIVAFVKSNVAYLRERYEKLATAFDQLCKPAPEQDLRSLDLERRAERAVPSPRPLPNPPEMSPRLSQSMNRLSHTLASEHMRGRKARSFKRSAHYELNMASSAAELRTFNEAIRAHIGADAILTHGSHQPEPDAAVLSQQPEAWQSFARKNWDAIFAAQWAETQATLTPLKAKAPTHTPTIQTEARLPMSDETTPTTTQPPILIEAVPDISAMPAPEVRAQAIQDPGLEYSVAVTRDVAGQIYSKKDGAVQSILERYAESGNAPEVLSELERDPAAFGVLKGATRLGIANAERRNALEKAPQLVTKAGAALHQVSMAEERIVAADTARRAAQAKPVPDLSDSAQSFLARAEFVHQLPLGEAKSRQMTELMKDEQAIKEVSNFRQSLYARYGKGHRAIQDGLANEPALKAKPAPERQAAVARVNTVIARFPAIVEMQGQLRQQERSRDRGVEQSKGFER